MMGRAGHMCRTLSTIDHTDAKMVANIAIKKRRT